MAGQSFQNSQTLGQFFWATVALNAICTDDLTDIEEPHTITNQKGQTKAAAKKNGLGSGTSHHATP